MTSGGLAVPYRVVRFAISENIYKEDMMKKDEKYKRVPLVHVHTTGQRAASSERIVVVQTNSCASVGAGAGRTKLTQVVSSSAGGTGDKPIKRIGAADVEKMLGAEAIAALERMRRGR